MTLTTSSSRPLLEIEPLRDRRAIKCFRTASSCSTRRLRGIFECINSLCASTFYLSRPTQSTRFPPLSAQPPPPNPLRSPLHPLLPHPPDRPPNRLQPSAERRFGSVDPVCADPMGRVAHGREGEGHGGEDGEGGGGGDHCEQKDQDREREEEKDGSAREGGGREKLSEGMRGGGRVEEGTN